MWLVVVLIQLDSGSPAYCRLRPLQEVPQMLPAGEDSLKTLTKKCLLIGNIILPWAPLQIVVGSFCRPPLSPLVSRSPETPLTKMAQNLLQGKGCDLSTVLGSIVLSTMDYKVYVLSS